MNPSTTIDCVGQRCPAPILATAKAARGLGTTGGGILEISADDDAFPLDIRSWCRSSGSELVDLHSDQSGIHKAIVRVDSRSTKGTTVQNARTPPPPPVAIVEAPTPSASSSSAVELEIPVALDFCGQRCPAPILGLARKARSLPGGTIVEIVADDPAFRLDLESWCRSAGATIVAMERETDALRAKIRLGGGRREGAVTTRLSAESSDPNLVSLVGVPATKCVEELEARLAGRGDERVRIVATDPKLSAELVQWISSAGHSLLSLDARGSLEIDIQLAPLPEPTTSLATRGQLEAEAADNNQCTLLVLHNDREALLAALLVAVGAAAQGMNVMMFFTFWGLNLLRGEEPNTAIPAEKVSWSQRMFKWMMPRGPRKQKLGKLHMGGLGGSMLGSIMKRYDLMDVPALMVAAEEQGVSFVACTMSMQVMGITKRDLAPRENLDYGGVAAFVESASRSRMSLTF